MRELYIAGQYPGKYEGEPPIVQYIDENYLYDYDVGDVDSWGEWYGQAGKWIIQVTVTGFIHGTKFATIADATDTMGRLERAYQIWEDVE